MPSKQRIDDAQQPPTGPYSPAIVVGDQVYVAGQGPLDPDTRQIVGKTLEEQAELTMNNIRKVLQRAGCSMDDCVKCTVYLADMSQWGRFNEVYRKFFNPPYPARTAVQAALWGGILVEVDAIAIKGCSSGRK